MLVGRSYIGKRVYVDALSRINKVYSVRGYEVVAIGTPVPFFRYPVGCSPNFGQRGQYYTAAHCVRGGRAKLNDGAEIRRIGGYEWKPKPIFCVWLRSYNLCGSPIRDFTVVDGGNEGDMPIGILSGGTVPSGVTFISPTVERPQDYIGKRVRGIARDYDANQFVEAEYEIIDYGEVYYRGERPWEVYIVEAWYARGFSKPGYSGTNLYPIKMEVTLTDSVRVHD